MMMVHRIAHFRILERVGLGSLGEVYKAEDLRLGRTVALKFLPSDGLSDPEARDGLISEARRAAALNHPNIATIHEFGQEEGRPYIVMEYVEGRTLASELKSGPLDIGRTLNIAIQTAEALKAAHVVGMVHCDLKSSNIMLGGEDRVKVLDFGLAMLTAPLPAGMKGENRGAASKDVRPAESRPDVPPPKADGISGTISFMSPEQARGERPNTWTDIYSLGVVIYQAVSARRPFEGENASEILHAILTREAPPLSTFRRDVPLELESIVRKAMSKDRDQRYRSAEEMLFDLKKLRQQLQQETGLENPLADIVSEDFAAEGPRTHAYAQERFSGLARRGLLVLSVLMALAPGIDWLIFQPQRNGPWRALGFLFLASLGLIGYLVLRRRVRKPILSLPRGAAFRGLLPFQEADRDRFHGREVDTAALFERVSQPEFRFGVLFGDSGCGKTSVLRAGLIPKLWEEGQFPIYCRSYKDPLTTLMEECRKRSQLSPHSTEPPLPYLRRIAGELDTGILIICDQFEEFFINFRAKKDREPFLSFVTECYHSADLPVKFLFSMRSDFLHWINEEFADRIPNPLLSGRLYHLHTFDEARAEKIISSCVEHANLPFETGLSRQIAHDLAVDGDVLPSELQIVGEQLQRRRIFTLEEYRRAGRKEALVFSFLEDVIAASGDHQTATLILRSLISDENTRLNLPHDEIVKRTQRSRGIVDPLLNLFVESRLICEIQDEDSRRYELTHEYLIDKINQLTGKVMDATQRANRLFRQYLSNYSVDRNTRIPLSKLLLIRRHSDLERGKREGELLRRSLRLGLFKSSVLAVTLAVSATLGAAALSVREEWDGFRMRDGHEAAARCAAFSPDGRLLVSCGEDSKVIVWDFARRLRIATLTDHSGWVTSVAFSPDGRWFATGGADKTVMVWDSTRLQKAAVLHGHTGPVQGVAFSPDGRWLASSGEQTILWSVGPWQKIRELPLQQSYGTLIFSPDSRQLMAASGEVFDVLTGQPMASGFHPERAGNWAALSPDARHAVTVTSLGEVAFYELSLTGDLTHRKLVALEDVHDDHGRAVAYSPDGRWVASGAEDIVLWDALTHKKLTRFEHTAIVWSLAFSPDGRWLVSTHGDGAILLWDVAEHERVANLNEHSAAVRAVAFSPDGNQIASASDDRSVIIWDARRRGKVAVLVGHNTRVDGVTFSPDGKWVASSDQDGGIILWGLDSGQPLRALKHQSEIGLPGYCVEVSPDGHWVSGSSAVFDSNDGRLVIDLNRLFFSENLGHIYGEDFSKDGRWLLCVTDRGYLVIWDTTSWQIVAKEDLKGIQLISARFSPDGKWLVTGEDQGFVRLWETRPLRQVGILGQHGARIKSIAISPDGRQVASAGDDQSISLWDVKRRHLIAQIGTHSAPVLSVAFSPDGRQLAAGGHDKSLRLYTRHRTLWGYRLD
ncbi:MAG: protein kinase [Acidobacteriia bacterium]|nr:protein kinase [Terriglobia bacterium]